MNIEHRGGVGGYNHVEIWVKSISEIEGAIVERKNEFIKILDDNNDILFVDLSNADVYYLEYNKDTDNLSYKTMG